MSITLAIMAAGIGSRFAEGCKQTTPVGPSGEFIMEYSIYDALDAGFDHVVFIIRKKLEEDFRNHFENKLNGRCKVDYAFQNIEELPGGFVKPKKREKPWGTGQAVLAAAPYIDGPFVVINADDFYGREAFTMMYDHLAAQQEACNGKDPQGFVYAMPGFVLGNTLSDHGAVTRGVCSMKEGYLTQITETRKIEKKGDTAISQGNLIPLDHLVSMNMWALDPAFMKGLEEGFLEFLGQIPEGDITAEFLLPEYIGARLKADQCQVKVYKTEGQWFGLTYSEDTPMVRQELMKLKDRSVYPDPLF